MVIAMPWPAITADRPAAPTACPATAVVNHSATAARDSHPGMLDALDVIPAPRPKASSRGSFRTTSPKRASRATVRRATVMRERPRIRLPGDRGTGIG